MRVLWLLLTAAVSCAFPQNSEFFETRIRPLFAQRCQSCHSSRAPNSGLALDSREGVERGGKRGTLFVPGDPAASLIIKAVSYGDATLRMPPTGKLPDAAIADLREWVRSGGEFPQATAAVSSIDWTRGRKHWAFQPIRDPALPAVKSTAGVQTPVDRFVLARLESEGLTLAAPADKLALLRRVTFDLTGLPPKPAEIQAFLNDPSPSAYERVVDRLLASPQYGERWARHWFDIVRFAETNGHEFDFYKYEAWRYRDYVIRAFNQDVPYDRFLAEHIAGDLLPNPRLAAGGAHWDSAIGSGFLGLQEERNGATDLEEVRSEMRDSRIDVFGKAFLGLTIACARCHDHKFDPIPTADYYALGGIIDSTRTSLGSIASPALLAKSEEIVARIAPSTSAGPARAPIALREGDELFEGFEKWHCSGSAFGHYTGGLLDSSRRASNKLTGILISNSFVPKKRYIHVRLAGTKFNPVREEPSLLAVTMFAPGRYPKGVAGNGDRTLRWKTITLKEEINQVCHLEVADRQRDGHIAVEAIVMSDRKEPPNSPEETLAGLPVSELENQLPEEAFGRVSYEDKPQDMRIHTRGNHLSLGEAVPRGFLEILGGKQPGLFSQGSGRTALAAALTARENPLVARVMVNRIWKHHFGEGLVGTVDNFGAMGEKPSHPELLDWLATRFMENGWSVKATHKLMVMSAAYRASTEASPDAVERDPRNRLLSHMPVRRLDAESIRDSILAVAGSLDSTVYGPSVTPHISEWQDGRGKPATPGPLDGKGRRSVYIEVRRNFLTPFLLAFDYPLPTTAVGRRMVSSVPSQALALMNNEFVTSQAARWARRMEAEYTDPNERLDAMYMRAFARAPQPAERARIRQFLNEHGTWAEVAHVLFNSKEFLFVR